MNSCAGDDYKHNSKPIFKPFVILVMPIVFNYCRDSDNYVKCFPAKTDSD